MTSAVEHWVEQHLEVTLRSGPEFMCRCPLHEDRNASLQVNVDKGLLICFSCDFRGPVKWLAERIGLSFNENDTTLAELHKTLKSVLAEPEPITTLPESYLRQFGLVDTNYWYRRRKLTDDIIDAWQLGFDALNNAGTIPIRDMRGKLLGVVRRALGANAFPKYKYPHGFKRADNLFASWVVQKTPTTRVVLTEGSLDAIKVWQAGFPAMAVYGSSLSRKQVRVLHQLGIDQVTLMFDNDEAGKQCAWGKKIVEDSRRSRPGAVQMLKDVTVRVVDYRGSRFKDPGAMPVAELADRIDTAQRVYRFKTTKT